MNVKTYYDNKDTVGTQLYNYLLFIERHGCSVEHMQENSELVQWRKISLCVILQ